MFKSQSSRSGILGTVLFHLFIFLICFFSSIGYTHVDIPSGLEIELIPYEQKNNLEDINKISGILNGTTNYILTKMKNDNLEFDKVLEIARIRHWTWI